jgi:ribosomal protein L7Ae-like RNA K-turn-binding protein
MSVVIPILSFLVLIVQIQESKKPFFVKYGLNHSVALIEAKKASLVIIAHDVDPIELVIFLPALCRKMGIPYVIVKGKARLGTVVHKKTAAVLTLQDVKSEDQRELSTLVSAAKANLYVMSSIVVYANVANCLDPARTSTRTSAVNGVVVSVETSPPRCSASVPRRRANLSLLRRSASSKLDGVCLDGRGRWGRCLPYCIHVPIALDMRYVAFLHILLHL